MLFYFLSENSSQYSLSKMYCCEFINKKCEPKLDIVGYIASLLSCYLNK